MAFLTEKIENDFQTRIDNGGRVYLSEVYKALGIETFSSNCQHAFWDKNGFHEYDVNQIIIIFDETEIKTLQCMYTEYADKLVSYTEIDDISIDEGRLNDLKDQYNVIQHLCYAIEGIYN